MKKLSRNFYTQKTLEVAQELLGKFIIRKIGGKVRVGMIVETEAYIGPHDRASHAIGGRRTPRNEAEFLIGGHIYIYLVYGMYWQLNISTSRVGVPECVLIRALEPVISSNKHLKPETRNPKKTQNLKSKFLKQNNNSENIIRDTSGKFVKIRDLANGPGKLCRWLKVDKSFYAEDMIKSKRIWLEDRGVKIKKSGIAASPRIGIDYAGPVWAKKPWRFYIKNNIFVSKS